MDWKKLGKKLLFPPFWVMAILTILSAAALIWVFTAGMEESVPAYLAYVLSFYTLSVVTLFCALVLPKQYRAIREKLYANPLTRRFLTDKVFRIRVTLTASFVVNLLYVGVHIWSFYRIRSWWFVVLAVYYGILAIMRYLLVGYVRIRRIGASMLAEWKRARLCACILLLVNFSLSGAVLMILYQSKGYDYPGIMIYVMALYTFYALTMSIVDLVKYRKMGSPIMSTAKIVSLSAALVSMLNLETAMFAQFGADMPQEDQQIFIILTGAGVSITVVALSVLLIVRANKEIRREKNGK